jgi:fluoroquinolone resistance protein
VFTHDAYLEQRFADLVLEEATVEGVEFERCHFSTCRFRATAFRACKFIECTFEMCDLSMIGVVSSRFTNTRFADCKIIGVNWTDASSLNALTTSMVFQRCNISYSHFAELDLKGLQVLECEAREVDFTEARLQRACFTGTDLAGARFSRTDLREANFVSAKNYAIDPTQNKVKKARFALPEVIGLLAAFDVVVEV